MTQPEAQPATETPKTDAAYQAVIDGGCLPGCDSHGHEEMCPYCNGARVMAEFAKTLERRITKLERDLAELREKKRLFNFGNEVIEGQVKEIDRLVGVVQEERAKAEAACRERDEAFERAAKVADGYVSAIKSMPAHHREDVY